MGAVQSGACDLGLIFAVFGRFRHIGHMAGNAVELVMCIGVRKHIGLNRMAVLAV